jgi:hypothetical protein
MTIYLGSSGHVELQRPTTEWMRTTVNNPDINVNQRRFSVNFYGDQDGAANTAGNARRPVARAEAEDSLYNFVTGDRVTIRTVSGKDLAFIPDDEFPDGKPHRSITRFVYLDQAGGMRLYTDFARALAGDKDGALVLNLLDTSRLDADTGPAGNSEVDNTYQLIEMRADELGGSGWRCLGEVTSYELVSERENIDTTALNQAYRQQYEAGIIQGSGRISAFWEHEFGLCENEGLERYPELSFFLAAVILRLEQGADFGARFYLTKSDGENSPQSLWYDCPKCVITNCSVSVEPTQIITADIDFVTTGKIRLKQGFPVDRLLQEETPIRSGGGYVTDEFSELPMELQNQSND